MNFDLERALAALPPQQQVVIGLHRLRPRRALADRRRGRTTLDILGHSSYQLTMNTYSHVAQELSSEAADLMAGALWDDAGEGAPKPRNRRRPS